MDKHSQGTTNTCPEKTSSENNLRDLLKNKGCPTPDDPSYDDCDESVYVEGIYAHRQNRWP